VTYGVSMMPGPFSLQLSQSNGMPVTVRGPPVPSALRVDDLHRGAAGGSGAHQDLAKPATLRVPTRGKGRVVHGRARGASGRSDADTLRLRGLPR